MKFALIAFGAMLATQSPIFAAGEIAPIASPTATIASPASGTVTVLLPAGTLIPVHLVGSLSSASAKPDDVFQIQVAEDVVVNDMVVVRQGSGGQGHIVGANGAGGSGRSGSISLAFDYVNSADGGRIRLSQAAQKQTEEDRKGASSTATIIGFATFGIGGLFGHNFAHGRQKTIEPKTIISAFVADNVHVDTSEHATAVRYNK